MIQPSSLAPWVVCRCSVHFSSVFYLRASHYGQPASQAMFSSTLLMLHLCASTSIWISGACDNTTYMRPSRGTAMRNEFSQLL